MESSSLAISAGDGRAARNESVTLSEEERVEVSFSSLALANGLHDYRFMKNGKPRPSAVRDFPKNIVPANRISDAMLTSEEKRQAPVLSKGMEEQKQIKQDVIFPATDKREEVNSHIDMGKQEKQSAKKSHPDQKPGKASMLELKKPQEESKKQTLASPETAKSLKAKDAPTEKTQKVSTKAGKRTDKKANVIASTISDEVEVEPNKGKGSLAERSEKSGKSVEKKTGANASIASDGLLLEAEVKSNKGKGDSTEKTPRTPSKLGESKVKKLSASASTVSDASTKKLREGGAKGNMEKDATTEKIQKMLTKPGKLVEKRVNDLTLTATDTSVQGAEQEVGNAAQGDMEAMDIDKQDDENKPCTEIEQDKQEGENPQEETKGEKIKTLHQVKRKSVIRDLPETRKEKKERDVTEGVQDGVAQKLDMKKGVREKAVPDTAKLSSNGSKKRPLEESDPSDRSKKLAKSKPSGAAQTSGKAKESSLVVTPKTEKPVRKSSTPSESGKKVRRSVGKSSKPTTMTDTGDPRKLVMESMRLYDAVRRMYVQDEERDGKQQRGSRSDLQAATALKDYSRGVEKAQGSFPGVLVGDIFLFRTELSFARVHGPIQAGIDYLTAKESGHNTPVAISIISNVGQEGEGEDKGEELIYTGQGGRSSDNKQIAAQKLERGNLALDGSKKYNVPVRVIRGIKDANSPSSKVYVYDGLYKVEETYTVKGSGGFDEYKFKLQRIPGQPALGSDTLKLAADMKKGSASRENIVLADISKGKESQPICVENSVDGDKCPAPFEYSPEMIYLDGMENLEELVGCSCKGACSPSSSCSCFSKNGDEFPYINGGYLVRQKDYIFECGSHCSCSSTCRNRTTQRGLKFQFDVFKTQDRGWGVRSLDLIPAGSFVCEYIGKLVTDKEEMKAVRDKEHLLDTRRLLDTTPRWGDVPASTFKEKGRSLSTVRPSVGNPELIIDAGNVGNVARFINHSCSPNLLIQKVLSDHQDVRYPQIKLFALDNIPPLRELTFDYGQLLDQELVAEEASINCLCGSIDCRGLCAVYHHLVYAFEYFPHLM